MELYVFKTMQHYADSLTALRRNESIADKPLKLIVSVLDIDFDYYRKEIKEKWSMTITECPFCFWNNISLGYLKPLYQKHPNPLNLKSLINSNIVIEQFIVCPHKLYDPEFLDYSLKKYPNSTIYNTREYFSNLIVDFNSWINKLRIAA